MDTDDSFIYTAQRLTKRILSDAIAVAIAPPVLLACGNLLLAGQTAEPIGIAINIATTFATVGCRAYEVLTNKNLGLPYYVLGGVNGATAISILANGYFHQIPDQTPIQTLWNTAKNVLLPAIAFLGWGAGHFIKGRAEISKNTPPAVLKNEQFYYGVGDIAAVHAQPIATISFLLGLARTFCIKPDHSGEKLSTASSVFAKHATPAKFYAAGYIIGALTTGVANPGFSVAQILWSLGYAGMDHNENNSLISDIQNLRKAKQPSPKKHPHL